MDSSGVIIIGGGIVGLATAYHLAQTHPRLRLVVLEKESRVAEHQTGHNSGVLHSGIYYPPGSLKAINCRSGKQRMEAFCRREGIPFELCGKVIVATHDSEYPRLEDLYQRGQANGVQCRLIDRDRLRELEPRCAGLKAIQVPETGIVNYRQVCERLAALLAEMGHRVLTGRRVIGLNERADAVTVQTPAEEYQGRYLVNCAGLQSDRVARLGGVAPGVRIVPFRGEYFQVSGRGEEFCRNLIYPVPDPRFPFLGVHFTRMVSGHVECGPNAVLAFAREGYTRGTIDLRDLLETLIFPGFLRLSSRFWWIGCGEMWRSVSKAAFVRALQRLIPDLPAERLVPAPAGVRAQAVAADGRLLDDFAFHETARVVHVLNAPSPAATASLSIGQTIVEKLAPRLGEASPKRNFPL